MSPEAPAVEKPIKKVSAKDTKVVKRDGVYGIIHHTCVFLPHCELCSRPDQPRYHTAEKCSKRDKTGNTALLKKGESKDTKSKDKGKKEVREAAYWNCQTAGHAFPECPKTELTAQLIALMEKNHAYKKRRIAYLASISKTLHLNEGAGTSDSLERLARMENTLSKLEAAMAAVVAGNQFVSMTTYDNNTEWDDIDSNMFVTDDDYDHMVPPATVLHLLHTTAGKGNAH